MIFQGDIFWVDLGDPVASGPAGRRPMVVIQNDTANQSAIHTVIMCALTTNLSRASAPGNVALDPGEGGTPNESVVNVSQVYTVDKTELTDAAYIGFLSPARMADITAGVKLFLIDHSGKRCLSPPPLSFSSSRTPASAPDRVCYRRSDKE